jgi:hypothetical protein
MHVLVHESLADRPVGPGRRGKESKSQSMYSEEVSTYKERKAVLGMSEYIPVHTGIGLKTYVPGTFFRL